MGVVVDCTSLWLVMVVAVDCTSLRLMTGVVVDYTSLWLIMGVGVDCTSSSWGWLYRLIIRDVGWRWM